MEINVQTSYNVTWFPLLDSRDHNPVAVHIAAKSSMQKAKGVWTLQAGRVEAVLQLKRVHDQDRMRVKDTLAAEAAEEAPLAEESSGLDTKGTVAFVYFVLCRIQALCTESH